MRLPIQNRSTFSIIAFLLLGLAAIFGLPYLFPEHDGLSYSYMFGFNNHAAMVILVLVAAGFALWTRGLSLALPDPSAPLPDRFRIAGYAAIGIAAVSATLLWLLTLPTTPYAEAQYFLDRYNMYRMFGHPYHAFTFYYGPIMFYLPLWIAAITRLSVPNSYYASLVLEWTLGTWVLWKAVRLAARGTTHGRDIFLIVWLLLFPSITGSGANYTPLRFVPAIAFALAVEYLYRRGSSIAITFGVASIGILGTLFYSPEQGISYFLGTVFFFLVCVRQRRPGTLTGLAAFMISFAVAAVVSLKMGVFNSVASISGGTLNFPLVADPMTLPPILAIIGAGCVVAASLRTRNLNHPLVYLICISLVNLPAALSRADPGHIIINSLGAIIAVLVVLSQYRAPWLWTRIIAAIVIALFLAGIDGYRQFIRNQVLSAAFGSQYHSPMVEKLVDNTLTLAKGRNGAQRIEQLRESYAKPLDPSQPRLSPNTGLMAPMEVPRRIVPLEGNPQIIAGRTVYPLTNVSVVQEKIEELKAHQNWPLILPGAEAKCSFDPYEMRASLKHVLGAIYLPVPRRRIVATAPLCDYINANYRPSKYLSPVPGYSIWLPKENNLVEGH